MGIRHRKIRHRKILPGPKPPDSFTMKQLENVMENQHRKITGYRELSQAEIAAMNHVKEIEQSLLKMIGDFEIHVGEDIKPDHRWLAIARTDLQKGFMALGRAIARPDGYPEDDYEPILKPDLAECEPILGAEVRQRGLEGKGMSGK